MKGELNGYQRFCVGWLRLDETIKRNTYPVPLTDEELALQVLDLTG